MATLARHPLIFSAQLELATCPGVSSACSLYCPATCLQEPNKSSLRCCMNHPSIGQIGPESGQRQTDGPLGLEYAAVWSPTDAAQVGYEPGCTNTTGIMRSTDRAPASRLGSFVRAALVPTCRLNGNVSRCAPSSGTFKSRGTAPQGLGQPLQPFPRTLA